MSHIKIELDNILNQEETKAWQRSRDRHIKEGDRNTSYFHALANQRRRKKRIAILDGPNGPVDSNAEMLKVASDFYKNLFAKEEKLDISLGAHFWEPDEMVTYEENKNLQKPFSVEEIKAAVFESYAGGAPGPDGFSFMFYQSFGT